MYLTLYSVLQGLIGISFKGRILVPILEIISFFDNDISSFSFPAQTVCQFQSVE